MPWLYQAITRRDSSGICSITWMLQNVGSGRTLWLMNTAFLPSGMVAYFGLAGSEMSNTCMPPFPMGLSGPGAHVEPGGTTPPPRSSVTNRNFPSGVGSASCEIDTPSSDRTAVWLLAPFVPGWLTCVTWEKPVADGLPACSHWVAETRQSLTFAAVEVPSATVHGSGVPRTSPSPSVRLVTSRTSVPWMAAQ